VDPQQPVVGGSIKLAKAATRIIVGLPYESDLETMPIEIVGQDGASVGRKKQVNAINVLFHETANGKAGTSFDKLQVLKWRTIEPYGEAPKEFSGIKRVVAPTMADNVVTACIRSDTPTPMTILAVMPQYKVNYA